jgi:soluble lytic murein transglycosylase
LYYKQLLDSLNDRDAEALAAYNAGKSRVDRWSSWGPFREQSEFIETIPFIETRNYVQIVLRNADVYRRIYESAPAPAQRSGAPKKTRSVPRKKTTPAKPKPKRQPAT